MLQKSIIALCTVFALSACGGSLDLGPDNPPTTGENGNGENGNGENGNGNGGPSGDPIWAYLTFDDEASIASWSYRCADGCNATADLEWNQEEEVLAISPEWASEDDNLEIYTSVDEIANMNDAAISAWVYVTEDYIVEVDPEASPDEALNGRLAMQMFLVNAADEIAYTTAQIPTRAGWHKLEAWEMQAGTAEAHEDEDVNEIDYGTFAWHSDGFTLRNINTFGVQFSSNGKPVEVGGQLWIDNVVLTPGAPRDVAPLIVDMASDNWTLQDGGSLELQRGDGTVFFNPDGTQQYSPKLAYMLSGPVDLTGLSITVTFSVDEAYIASGGNIDVFVQENFGSYRGNFDGDSACQVVNEDLVAGEETEHVCSDLPDTAVAEEGQQLRVGVQADGSDGTVTVHALEIEGAGGPVDPDASLEAPMDAGWRVNPESLEFGYSDDGAFYGPIGIDSQLVYDFSGPQEFAGSEYTFVFTVDQEFKESGAGIQPFFQRTDDFNIGNYCNTVVSDDLVVGEDNEVTCGPLSDDFDFDDTGSVQVGFQTKESEAAGTITIKSLTIN